MLGLVSLETGLLAPIKGVIGMPAELGIVGMYKTPEKDVENTPFCPVRKPKMDYATFLSLCARLPAMVPHLDFKKNMFESITGKICGSRAGRQHTKVESCVMYQGSC